MPIELAERFTASTEEWTCACGRANATGLSLCPHCGRVPPRGVNTISFDLPGRAEYKPRVRGVRLAFGVILLNIVTQAFVLGLVQAGRMESSKAIALSMWIGLVFYAVVLGMLAGPMLTLRPKWVKGDPQTAWLLGAEVGLAFAGVLIALLWAASGHPVLDPGAQALVSEGSITRVLLAFLVIAVAAPVVEELLFRGVVAESLRGKGAAIAIFVSSVLFALAHLRGLVYYTGCGAVLGILYWRRGLWASISAHAAFNGSLVLLAVVVALGPAHVVSAHGVSVHATSDWQVAEGAGVPADAQLALKGPSGATLLVQRHPLPGTRRVDLDAVAAALNSGRVPLPPDSAIAGQAHVVRYPAGQGVEVGVTEHGHAGVVVMIPRGAELWEVDIGTAGSDRAAREYPDLLQSLVLPGGGA
jgi:membrane protease YdiL (CAAX protease family)